MGPPAGRIASPYERLAGDYVGVMHYPDLTDRKEKSFSIELKVVAYPDGISMATKFRFAPGRFSLSVTIASAEQQGTRWRERTPAERLEFELRGWPDFTAQKTNWFEFERPTLSDGQLARFKRRWTVTDTGLTSEKWLKFPGKDWEFSHSMKLELVK